jgi:hypothetical protein
VFDVRGEQEEELVQYEGMLVSASAAQRRQFFAALIQRASKMHKRLGGGSLTMVGALAGEPATGISKRRQVRKDRSRPSPCTCNLPLSRIRIYFVFVYKPYAPLPSYDMSLSPSLGTG